jgi:hypothetical protein
MDLKPPKKSGVSWRKAIPKLLPWQQEPCRRINNGIFKAERMTMYKTVGNRQTKATIKIFFARDKVKAWLIKRIINFVLNSWVKQKSFYFVNGHDCLSISFYLAATISLRPIFHTAAKYVIKSHQVGWRFVDMKYDKPPDSRYKFESEIIFIKKACRDRQAFRFSNHSSLLGQ